MADNWRLALKRRYPQFLGESGPLSVADGWQDLLDRALARIAAAVVGEPADSGIRIVQIKEKYGTLRLYYDSRKLSAEALGKAQEAVDLAEARSACTCEECGAEGRLYDRGGWYLTRCPDHATGEPVRTKPGWDNLRVVRTVRRGKLRIASCRRYDRERDIFVEVPLPPEES